MCVSHLVITNCSKDMKQSHRRSDLHNDTFHKELHEIVLRNVNSRSVVSAKVLAMDNHPGRLAGQGQRITTARVCFMGSGVVRAFVSGKL